MIESKYGLKYSFPHSVVHIVDNSVYTGELPAVIAQDPSLYSTMVVTALPMGEDNRFINLTRTDIANAAFGLYNLTTADREKFGQAVDYPINILNQGVPVKLMRVTPEDATYAYASIVVQWRWDSINHTMHVRFKNMQDADIDIYNGITKKELNNILIKRYNKSSVDSDGYTWKQRVFMNVIAAGRGSVYNNMSFAINPISQAKRPANMRYQFITIDSRKSQPIETYYASLINVDNNRSDAIETSNIQVGKRVQGSSILVPYVNESAIKEIYKEYMAEYTSIIADPSIVPPAGYTRELIENMYKLLNINIFDIIYGKYIYNGGLDTKLPFYQVDMVDSSIVSLGSDYRLATTVDKYEGHELNPPVMQDKITNIAVGIKATGDAYYIGDLYLTYNSDMSNPRLVFTAMINQYTGSITNVTIKQVHPLISASEINTSKSVPIKKVYASEVDMQSDKSNLTVGDVVGLVNTGGTGGFALYTLTDADTLTEYSELLTYTALDLDSTTAASGIGNIIGRTNTDSAYLKVGGTRLVNGVVTINGYNTTYDTPDVDLIATPNKSRRVGEAPTSIEVRGHLGDLYDVLVYSPSSVASWNFTKTSVRGKITISESSTQFVVGDEVSLGNDGAPTLTFKITNIDEADASVYADLECITDPVTTNAAYAADTNFIVPEGKTDTMSLVEAITADDYTIKEVSGNPTTIKRYRIAGITGSLFRITEDPANIPANYYSNEFGINLTSELGGVTMAGGSTGFLDNETINPIVFKYLYSEMLVKAFRGQAPYDPRIMSPKRIPAFHLFDAATNTIVGQTIIDGVSYSPSELITASTIFTADEKDEIILNESILEPLKNRSADIDVKRAMYDLMVERNFQGIPEDKRPVGDGSGLSLYLDTGVVDTATMLAINNSFSKRFTNYNCSWDIGGVYDSETGLPYTYTRRLVDNLFTHCLTNGVNKPFTGPVSAVPATEYTEAFPDIDAREWELRELLYNSGGNAWIADENGNLVRQSQRTLKTDETTSDLIQESNVRTLSQLVYILQNTIDKWLLQYADDGVIQTLSDEVNNKFANWVGNEVSALKITFTKDINIDGGDILRCDVAVTFRGLILRVPIIVDITRRES